MAESSPETLKTAVQALSRVHAVEGPPGENGLRTVWHMGTDGAELMSQVDSDGRVRRQELTLLEDHYMWASGEGVRTGRVESEGERARPAAAVVKADPQLVPHRLVRAAQAMGTYTGQDRYILHMQRVLALAREGLEMAGAGIILREAQRPSEPTLPSLEAPSPAPALAPAAPLRYVHGAPHPEEVTPPEARGSEGVIMLVVFGVGVVAGVLLLIWLL
ncbi:hypothetical protein HUA75_32435 [Myxococcus sp. CA040A]|uniref:Uncharacterized protein n=2 Tax=Myxococcus llanfairpwllgwyngyllgogerychwyrndrobwllllantysiliogogogochensis TaxID=2590453 RepID=A0A540X5M6_9BACT|nr:MULTISPECIES: hypothetical protein [unclassified Myxococcus]NTX06481.1 hypothetical protein [Myxococcus sp. CA040A]NTX35098.1 hypothetical protein [Myxococcus sp. CA033]NTX50530.1 hypothetical protein [Myxococcus sp. CA039A]TQF16500.1 hypothetical protein FJV41_07835 [Myxococcus llanfairpwllgwyngyllgogerychwyrndrobwllllantysiliogogogochensis]